MAVIETRGLTKDFGNGKGLFDLDLTVEPRRIHGFLGPNGAGKTTTIRLLLDFLRPDRGASRVLGLDPTQHAERIRAQVGYVPGELAMPEHLTGRRFLDDSAAIRGHIDADWRAQLIERLDAEVDRKIRKLSKGNKQKIALIDALQHRPPLLILDEPTDGLDPLLRHHVEQILRAHARAGGTVFLSSHVVHEIQTTCDEVSIVLDGRLQRVDRIDALLAHEPVRIQATVRDLAGARARLTAVGAGRFARRGQRIRFEVMGSMLPAMAALHDLDATEVTVEHDLEDAFLRMYERGRQQRLAARPEAT